LFAVFVHYTCGFTKEFIAWVVWQVMRYGIAGLCVKFGANPFKNGGVMAV